MSMSRPELDGWLSALQKMNGVSSRKGNGKDKPVTRQKFKSLRKKRKPKRHGR